MHNHKINIANLASQLTKATQDFRQQAGSFNEHNINTKPARDRWSAAQVIDHVTQSNLSISKALQLNGTPINRDPGERISELKEVFLDFTTRFQSPSFILPSKENYEKEDMLGKLEHSMEKIHELSKTADLTKMINHPAFGDITKLEILHFVIYHTQRHQHQLENIFRALDKNTPS